MDEERDLVVQQQQIMYDAQIKRITDEQRLAEMPKRKEAIEAMKKLELKFGNSPLAVHSRFDLLKVFMGAQPGDYMSFGGEQAKLFEGLLNDLSRANSDFHYVKRPAKWDQGKSYLHPEHQREISRDEKAILKHFSDEFPDGKIRKDKDDVLFIYFNQQLIDQQERGYGLRKLVQRVFNINEFLDIIGHAPILTPTRNVVAAHIWLGFFFSFPPCCIENYPRTVGYYRHFLEEKYEMYTEHVPCRPDCKLSIMNAKLNRIAFKVSGLDVKVLRDDARKWFTGIVNFQSAGIPEETFRKLADKYSVTMISDNGRYRYIHKTRKSLSEMCYELHEMPGIRNLNTNTVLNKRH